MSPNNEKIKLEMLYFITTLLFIVINLLGFAKIISSSVNFVFTPLISVGSEIGNGIRNSAESVTSIFDIRKERNDLLLENARLKAEIASTRLIGNELDSLRAELNYDSSIEDSLQASVISWSYGSVGGGIILNKGSIDGVKKGNAVTIGSIYIGVVTETDGTTSIVRLPSNRKSTYEVMIIPYQEEMEKQDEDSIERITGNTSTQIWSAVCKGEGGQISLENIPKNASVKVGDHVLIADKDIPDHYYVGDISKMIVDPADVQLKAVVTQPINIENITKVFIHLESE